MSVIFMSGKTYYKGFCFISIPLYLLLLVLPSCSSKKNNSSTKTDILDSLELPIKTNITTPDDNKKPKVTFLKDVSKPIVFAFPKNISNVHSGVLYENGKLQSGGKKAAQLYTAKNTYTTNTQEAQGKGFFTNFTSDNGLALDQVYCSYQDRMGNIWFGTAGGGVSKYDGKSFINYNTYHGLANNTVWCITEEKFDNIWFGTDGNGISKFDGKAFTNYSTDQGLSNNIVYSIKEDRKGNLWIGTSGGGLCKYDGKYFTTYTTKDGLASNDVKDIIEDLNGNLWFATLGGGVSKYDGKKITKYSFKQGLSDSVIWCLLLDKKGNIWLGSDGKGAYKYDGKTFTNYNENNGLYDKNILSLTEDKHGNIWMGSRNHGSFKYDGNNFLNYTTKQGLANNTVRSIIEDKSGNLWFGTFGSGISKYAGNSFSNFTIEQGLANNVVYSITDDKDGDLWFCTNNEGICKYDGKQFVQYNKKVGLPDNSVYCIYKDHFNNLWFGTFGKGISKYDGKNITNYTTEQGLANNVVFSILQDRKGNYWFGTSGGGVSKFDGKSFTNYTTAQGLGSNVVYSMTEDKSGNIWIGTFEGGVSKYDGESFTNYTIKQGLGSNVVWNIKEDNKGNLWFATQEGLSLLEKDWSEKIELAKSRKLNFPIFKTFTTKDGLPDNFVTQVVQGDDSTLYVGTNLGVCELFYQNKVEKKWSVGKVFNQLNGYPVKDVNTGLGAMYKDSTGIIWIGTGSDRTGLVRFDPKSIDHSNNSTPLVFIQSIKLNNENICWSDLNTNIFMPENESHAYPSYILEEINTYRKILLPNERDSIKEKYLKISFDSISRWFPIPYNLVLPYINNNVKFDFNAIEVDKNFLVKYSYLLEGYDNEWSPEQSTSTATFGNITEGTYTFMLKAKKANGKWSNPIRYSFTVLPPWWRTWWMYTLYFIMAISLIILAFWWNNRRLVYQKRILEHKIKVATKQIREEKEVVETQKRKIEETIEILQSTQVQLIQSEKMASLGELTAGIAHEIQNPLNFVNNFSDVNIELLGELKDEIKKGNLEEVHAIADDVISNEEKINHHGKRADAIVKGMLQHSRSSNGIKEPTDINALCDEYLRLAYHGLRAKDKSFNATMKTDFDKTIGNINIIPQDIGRVILNLINNAFYVVDEKKKLGIENYEPIVTVKTKKVENKVLISVKDNGNGIPQKILAKIFQPFFTTKPTGQGTGLGLSLSYDIVKAHGGELMVETKEGEGSEFVIQLPVV